MKTVGVVEYQDNDDGGDSKQEQGIHANWPDSARPGLRFGLYCLGQYIAELPVL
jgi:hypothetical protein